MIAAHPLRGLAAPALFAALLASPALADRAERPLERRFGPEIRSVELENLAGRVEIRRAEGGRIAARIQAEASAGEPAAHWLRAVDVAIEPRGDRLVVRAVYPIDDHRKYHYPGLGADAVIEPGWLSLLFDVGSSTVDDQGRRVRLVGRPSAGAPTVWVDFTLELPEGVAVAVRNAVGRIDSRELLGDQRLESGAGDIAVAGGRGAVAVETGSGDVAVERHEGDLVAETGSGDVEIADLRAAAIDAETGSGDVRIERSSGSIRLSTGSGDIVGRWLDPGRRLRASTGSGDVKLAGDLSAVRDLEIDTGSGDVALTLTGVPSVQLVVSTGSGDIDVDVSSMRIRKRRDEFVADLGTAEGSASIGTGSGDVVVREGR
jgi:hypothetical protein